jgi:cell division protein FtsW (lipid II flippase)
MFIKRLKTAIPICKFIASVILLYIVFSFIGNVAMLYNWLPVTGFHFPFVSYNRFTLIFDLCLMGILIRMTDIGSKPIKTDISDQKNGIMI